MNEKDKLSKKKFVNDDYKFCSNSIIRMNSVLKLVKSTNVKTLKVVSDTPIKPKRKCIPKRIRDTLWRDNFKSSIDGNCYCCSAKIQIEAWEASHVIAASNGGSDTIDNLRPCCVSCNRSMGKINMNSYISKYYPSRAKELGIFIF